MSYIFWCIISTGAPVIRRQLFFFETVTLLFLHIWSLTPTHFTVEMLSVMSKWCCGEWGRPIWRTQLLRPHVSPPLSPRWEEPRLVEETWAMEVRSHVSRMEREDSPSACWSLVPVHAGHFAPPLVERLLKSKHQSIFLGSLSPLLFSPSAALTDRPGDMSCGESSPPLLRLFFLSCTVILTPKPPLGEQVSVLE